jgi:ATP-binding protein involved in chromosome partitioning
MMSAEDIEQETRLRETLAGIKHVIIVLSGKGGVGKSTVSSNLAISLSKEGYQVGIMDLDITGPNIPKMFHVEDSKLLVENERLIPVMYPPSLNIMSMAFLLPDKDSAIMWRGPVKMGAVRQCLEDVDWGTLDYLVIDMPPGTGDIHISLVGDIPMEGAVIVTTPQDVALADVEKGVNMFRNPSVNRPIFGLVENMAWFTPEAHPEEKYYLFGKDGGAAMAEHFGIPLLGQIPLVQSIREAGDQGEPVALGTRPDSLAFLELAQKLVAAVNKE